MDKFELLNLFQRITTISNHKKILGGGDQISKKDAIFVKKNGIFSFLCKLFTSLKGFIPVYPIIYFDDKTPDSEMELYAPYYHSFIQQQQTMPISVILSYVFSKKAKFYQHLKASIKLVCINGSLLPEEFYYSKAVQLVGYTQHKNDKVKIQEIIDLLRSFKPQEIK